MGTNGTICTGFGREIVCHARRRPLFRGAHNAPWFFSPLRPSWPVVKPQRITSGRVEVAADGHNIIIILKCIILLSLYYYWRVDRNGTRALASRCMNRISKRQPENRFPRR